ncbi:MAG: RdgB/HAM1 family non-canonical purine NTP pyrophosphatase [Bacteroidota bacterium]
MKQLVVATNNRHKLREIKTILGDMGVDLLTLDDFPGIPPLVEDGETFQENALKKARTVHRHTKLPALADDSGLEVFYLNMRPGVRSARYAGDSASDTDNNDKLLIEMRGVAPRRRRVQFRSVLALVGEGYEELTEGICTGVLAETPRGTNGFGYDPLFLPDGMKVTYAELSDSEKNTISHRAKSLATMKPLLTKHRPEF